MDLHLKGKTFIVTGGANGIGRAICEILAAESASVVIVDKSKDGADDLSAFILSINGKCSTIIGDLNDPGTSKSAVDIAIDSYGQIDGIVNNAGKNDGVGLQTSDPVEFRRSVLANLGHYYDTVHYALPHLIKTKGSIVNISSKTALTGQGGTSAYVASKGAQLSLTREWALELAPYEIRVNAIIPAEVRTSMYDDWLATFDDPEAKLKNITRNIPLSQRLTLPEEIASMTAFLLSDRSAHTTGQWIHVDGGYVHLDRAST